MEGTEGIHTTSTNSGVFLWCSPRCISTAFECCIRQLPNMKFFHEPFSPPFYIGPGRTNLQYAHIPVDDSKTFSSVAQEIEDSLTCGKYENVFCKDMSFYIEGRFDILQNSFKKSKHTFLIRHPAQALLSFYKECGVNYVFNPNEAGFKQQYEMYKFVKDKLDDSYPVVIDIGDVLMDPEGMMQVYCEAAGLKYKPGMTSWPSHFMSSVKFNNGLCDIWHEQLLKTTGLQKSTVKKPLPSNEELPDIVKRTIKEQMPFYEALHSIRLKPRECSQRVIGD